jgi:diguanylate cyclase (GGDEF)-like protein
MPSRPVIASAVRRSGRFPLHVRRLPADTYDMAADWRYPFTNPFADPGDRRGDTIRLLRIVIVSMYLLGGATMLAVRFLPDPGFKPGTDTYHTALIVFMLGFGAFTWAMPRLPDWWYLLAGYAGVVAVSVNIALLEELRPIAFFYVWPAIAGAFFAQRREAVIGFLIVLITYIPVVLLFHDNSYRLEWIIDVGVAIGLVVLLVFLLKARSMTLVDELDRRASTDPLTGIANRATFERELEHRLDRSREHGLSCAVISLDLDRFKQVNDIYGHQAGDDALRECARIVAACLGDRGTLARVGGEEFAVVMPDLDMETARLVAEDIRVALERGTAATEPSLTVSIGVAAYPPSGDSPSSLMLAADRALYAAKQAGRNQVVVADESAERLLELVEQDRVIKANAGAQTALRLAEQLDLHRYGDHRRSEHVGDLAAGIAEELGMNSDIVGRIRLAGVVRDIGMLGVPEALFASGHALTPEEREVVERHVENGTEVLTACGLPELATWVAAHHERPDGSGYPRGLAGGAIPLPARVIAVAEAYASLTQGPGVEPVVALSELRECAGSQFDDAVVKALARVLVTRGEVPAARVA